MMLSKGLFHILNLGLLGKKWTLGRFGMIKNFLMLFVAHRGHGSKYRPPLAFFIAIGNLDGIQAMIIVYGSHYDLSLIIPQ